VVPLFLKLPKVTPETPVSIANTGELALAELQNSNGELSDNVKSMALLLLAS
jgi:hypothetical protein